MEAIYEQAIKEGKNGIDTLGLRITFGEAESLDFTYFGFTGEYWLAAYDYPSIGDILPIGVVTKVGFLTFTAE